MTTKGLMLLIEVSHGVQCIKNLIVCLKNHGKFRKLITYLTKSEIIRLSKKIMKNSQLHNYRIAFVTKTFIRNYIKDIQQITLKLHN